MTSTLSLEAPDVARDVDRLGPYARRALEQAADHAHRLHAEEVAIEHVLSTVFLDESAAATRLVLYAFADPETLAIELLALSPGIMVVGSGRSLPFSVRGVRALVDARARAAAAGAAMVTPADVFACSAAALDPEVRGLLSTIGLTDSALGPEGPAAAVSDGGDDPVPAEGPLFHRFRQDARRALGAAARAAGQWGRASISPAHLLFGSLEADTDLASALDLRSSRLRMALGGRDEDLTPLEPRRLPPDADLAAVLASVDDGASTVSLLGHVLTHGSEEIRLLLQNQKVTWDLYERAHGSFEDPD